jgi:hypothetical protein
VAGQDEGERASTPPYGICKARERGETARIPGVPPGGVAEGTWRTACGASVAVFLAKALACTPPTCGTSPALWTEGTVSTGAGLTGAGLGRPFFDRALYI